MKDQKRTSFEFVKGSVSEELQRSAEHWTPQHVLNWAFEAFGNRVAISSAFGVEGMVIIDMASRIRRDFRLFTVDTEFLFPETYKLMDRIEERYGVTIERAFSLLSPEEQERTHGTALWSRDPDLWWSLRVQWGVFSGLRGPRMHPIDPPGPQRFETIAS